MARRRLVGPTADRREVSGMLRSILPKWWLASLLLTGVGLLTAGVLVKCSLALLPPAGPGAASWCSAFVRTGPDTTVDVSSWLLGVPWAAWGLVYFAIVAALLVLARLLEHESAAEALLGAELVVSAGAATGVALSLAQWIGPAPRCTWCFVPHATSVLLLFTVHRANASSW